MINCDKWKTGCHHCPQYREYPGSYVDRTETMYNLKKRWFNGIHNLTIVTPSQWLASHVKESYLKDYPVKVIHNGIDLSIFKPTKSEFRKNYNIENKFIVLGVAFDWGKRKGRDVFIDLAKKLDDRYKIVLVGTDDKVDRQLPGNIISIHRTNNQHELVKIYSAADVFVNPTLEDNFPTTNIESIACGTPVITFNTGGSPEILDDTCGSVVQCNVNEALIKEIIRTCTNKPYSQEACLTRARQYDVYENFLEYIELYKTLMEENNETIFEKNDFKE
jgi:glycosyltransferase involved in cell wall biosynthesis